MPRDWLPSVEANLRFFFSQYLCCLFPESFTFTRVFSSEIPSHNLFTGDPISYSSRFLPTDILVCRETEASGQRDSYPTLLLVQLPPRHEQSAFEHRMPIHGKSPSLDAIVSLDRDQSSSNCGGSPAIVVVLRVTM